MGASWTAAGAIFGYTERTLPSLAPASGDTSRSMTGVAFRHDRKIHCAKAVHECPNAGWLCERYYVRSGEERIFVYDSGWTEGTGVASPSYEASLNEARDISDQDRGDYAGHPARSRRGEQYPGSGHSACCTAVSSPRHRPRVKSVPSYVHALLQDTRSVLQAPHYVSGRIEDPSRLTQSSGRLEDGVEP